MNVTEVSFRVAFWLKVLKHLPNHRDSASPTFTTNVNILAGGKTLNTESKRFVSGGLPDNAVRWIDFCSRFERQTFQITFPTE
jgi:hypothetical protein